MKGIFIVLIMVILPRNVIHPQEEKKPVSLHGYINTLQSAMFEKLNGPFTNENIIHNRLNFKSYFNNHLTFAIELRNRLFTGDMVRLNDKYAEMIGNDSGWIDMSFNILNEPSILFNTTIDRLLLDFNYKKFQVTIGRQRINWANIGLESE